MSSINASNTIINQNYRKTGVLGSSDINRMVNPVSNIMADTGVNVSNYGSGLTITGQGRLPFDDRLAFGIRMDGFIDSETDWKVTIYSGKVYVSDVLNNNIPLVLDVAEEQITLVGDTEYVYVQVTNTEGVITATLEHSVTAPDYYIIDESTYSTVTSYILYEFEKQSDNTYLLMNIYRLGIIYAGRVVQLPQFWLVFDENTNYVLVIAGYWKYNGKIVLLDGLIALPFGLGVALDTGGDKGYVVLHMELDSSTYEPTTLTANYVKDADYATYFKDKYEHNYWTLGRVDPTAEFPNKEVQYWRGGCIETINVDTYNVESDPKPHKKYHHLYLERDANVNSHVTIFEFPRCT